MTQPVTSLCIITFQKSCINLKSTPVITPKYIHVSVVLVIFHYYMLKNKQSNSHSIIQYDVGVVVLFAYPVKLNILTRNGVTKILPKKLFYLIFPIQPSKCWTKFRFINTLVMCSLTSNVVYFICYCCRQDKSSSEQ